jgi:hypothetical protein
MHRCRNLTAFYICLLLSQAFTVAAQPGWQQSATVIRTTSSHTAFPGEKRMNR